MIVGIIGAMEEEIRVLKERLIEMQEVKVHQSVFYQGMIHEKSVVLVQSGIGKVNASIITTLLVQQFNVDVIINTGTAGGLTSHLKVGDVVIANELVHHDVDVCAFGYKKGQMAGMPESYFPTIQYMTLAKKACHKLKVAPVLGKIVSGDQFIHSQKQRQHIVETFDQAIACEMESAAIAQTAYVLGVPFVIIRSISDNANETAEMSFDEFVLLAGSISANIVCELIKQL